MSFRLSAQQKFQLNLFKNFSKHCEMRDSEDNYDRALWATHFVALKNICYSNKPEAIQLLFGYLEKNLRPLGDRRLDRSLKKSILSMRRSLAFKVNRVDYRTKIIFKQMQRILLHHLSKFPRSL